MSQCSGCDYWIPKDGKRDERNYGDCSAPIKWPDSTYARGGCFRRQMRGDDGRTCPCFSDVLRRCAQG